MTLRLDGLYDVIVELEEKIEDVKLRRKVVEQDAITLENIYTLLADFEKVHDKISDEEKKSLISSLIKEIEIFPCDDSQLPLKSILFNFTVYREVEMFTNLCGTKVRTSPHIPLVGVGFFWYVEWYQIMSNRSKHVVSSLIPPWP